MTKDLKPEELRPIIEERHGKHMQPMLFPIRVDDAVMQSRTGWAADIRRSRHIGDFTNWQDQGAYQQAFDKLLQDLREEPALKAPLCSRR